MPRMDSPVCLCIFVSLLPIIFGAFQNRPTLVSNMIPDTVIECYKQKVTLLPMTLTTLIDIIRKVELNQYFILDMRLLSNVLLHRFWRDGIERDPNIVGPVDGVVPFKTTGFQNYKYKILIPNLIPGLNAFFPNESLTLEEQCTMHFMLSSTVDVWERGDESTVCPTFSTEQVQSIFQNSGIKKSSCPIELGVVNAGEYGTISPSHLIAAIATTLAPMQIRQAYLMVANNRSNDTDKLIDNKWAATFAGDLAEVVVIQAPFVQNLYLGPGGKWNDSILSTKYYMHANYTVVEKDFWQCTDAELLGSIDGMIMAKEAERWIPYIPTLRLSQILEMYYSDHRGNFPTQSRACERRSYFYDHLFHQGNVITQQTQYFAEILASQTPHYFSGNQYITEQSEKVFQAFRKYMPTLLTTPIGCPERESLKPKLNLTVIFDSTWHPYETLKLLMAISGDVDVSDYGSQITAISGKLGFPLVTNAPTVSDFYMQWMNSPDDAKDPVDLELAESFNTLKRILEDNSTFFRPPNANGKVVLVLGLSTSLTNKDIAKSKSVLGGIKAQYPEMQIIYVTRGVHVQSYLPLTMIPSSQNDHILQVDYQNPARVRQKIKDYLTEVPRSLRSIPCQGEKTYSRIEFEDYVTPGIPMTYKIHPRYLCFSARLVTLQFQNRGYGNIVVCTYRDENIPKDQQECQEAAIYQSIAFKTTKPCPYSRENHQFSVDPNCKAIYLTVTGRRSLGKCAENDCRFPDQIRFNIIIDGLQCIKDGYVFCSGPRSFSTLSLLFILLNLLFLI